MWVFKFSESNKSAESSNEHRDIKYNYKDGSIGFWNFSSHYSSKKKSAEKVIKKNNFVQEIWINKVFVNVMRIFKYISRKKKNIKN